MCNFHHPCLLASSQLALLCTPANDKRSSMPALLCTPAYDKRSSAPALLFITWFWCPICLLQAPPAFLAPHLPFGAHTCLLAPHLPFASPICLIGTPLAFWHPHLPFGAPFAFCKPHLPFWNPICLLALTPAFWCLHLPFWHPICLLAPTPAFWRPHLPFASPICLLAPILSDVHFQLWPNVMCYFDAITPNFFFFWKYPWKNVRQQKGALVFNSQGTIYGWHHHHVQWPISSTNCFCNSCSIFPTCQDVPQTKSSFCLGTQ